MRNYFLALALMLTGIAFTGQATAQQQKVVTVETATKTNGKYAILVQNPKMFMAAVMTGQEYKAKNKDVEFEVILIGQVVKDLAESDQLKPLIANAEKLDIQLVVCEMAMDNLGVKKSQYPASVSTTANGFTYIFDLQESGFKTITL